MRRIVQSRFSDPPARIYYGSSWWYFTGHRGIARLDDDAFTDVAYYECDDKRINGWFDFKGYPVEVEELT